VQELLPLLLGVVIGMVALRAPSRWPSIVYTGLGCICAGALVSWLNGEFSTSLWALFVSVDALLVWLGAASYAALRMLRTAFA
jgi:hypothetical protein